MSSEVVGERFSLSFDEWTSQQNCRSYVLHIVCSWALLKYYIRSLWSKQLSNMMRKMKMKVTKVTRDIYDSEPFIDSSPNKITEAPIGPLINKVREIILMFRKSPTKNDILQQYIKTDFGKDIVLLKDCRLGGAVLFNVRKFLFATSLH